MTAFGSVQSASGLPNSSIPDNDIKPTVGVILGKFLPPHRGHEYLAHFAESFVDKLWIFVCSLPSDPIPGRLRAAWMQELFPAATIIHIEEVNSAANRQQVGAYRIWADAVMRHLPLKPDYVFASEDYGWDFAEALGARFIPVDPSRDQFPISGTELRSRPFRHWHYLPAVVRPHFVREIMIEVPGKRPELAEEIIQKAAILLNTLYIPIYLRFYQEFSTSTQHPLDQATQAKAQAALINALKSQARCFLFRSSCELDYSLAIDMRPDLLIKLDFGDRSLPNSTSSIETLTLVCTPETAAHAIRDMAIDRFKDWF